MRRIVIGASLLLALLMSPAAFAQTPSKTPPPQFADMGECKLETGLAIRDCRIAYRTFGTLNAARGNAVLFPTWYGGTGAEIANTYVGTNALVDPAKYFVIVVDAFGDGVSSSPSNSAAQAAGAFPRVSIRDMVRQQKRLIEEKLGISHLHAVVGISMGAMQALEWSVAYPGAMDKTVAIAGSPLLATYDLVLWDTYTRAFESVIECRCATPLAILNGTRFLMAGPDFHALNTPAADKENVREQMARVSVPAEGVAYDRILQLQAMIGHDISKPYDGMAAAAKRVRSKMMIVAGLKDDIVTPGPVLSFAPLVKAEVMESATCGHNIPRCDGERILPAVREFLAR